MSVGAICLYGQKLFSESARMLEVGGGTGALSRRSQMVELVVPHTSLAEKSALIWSSLHGHQHELVVQSDPAYD